MNELREGGCGCGALRYRIEGNGVALIACHCTECQRQSGSAFGMSLVVRREHFQLLSGQPKTYTRLAASGREVDCVFCDRCGIRIYHSPRYLAETLNVKPGTLDDTSWLAPKAHVWTDSKQPWVPIPDDAKQVGQQP